MILRSAKASATGPFCSIWSSDIRSISYPSAALQSLKRGSSSTLVLRLSLATAAQTISVVRRPVPRKLFKSLIASIYSVIFVRHLSGLLSAPT